uniref:Granzyme C n=1 Tax=Aceria tosichella TaxID=561515 RepID=A0A6G1S472_9ACAR
MSMRIESVLSLIVVLMVLGVVHNVELVEVDASPSGIINIPQSQPVSSGEFPFIVGFSKKGGNVVECGGIILDEWHILTTARCFKESTEKLEARVGWSDLECCATIEIASYISHEDYDSYNSANNLALVKTATRIPVSNSTGSGEISPAPLPNQAYSKPMINFPPEKLTIAGWGRDRCDYKPNGPLKKATLIYAKDMVVCDLLFSREFSATNGVCVGSLIDTPRSEVNGGPLLKTYDNGERAVIGLVSDYYPLCNSFSLSHHVLIYPYLNWIAETKSMFPRQPE